MGKAVVAGLFLAAILTGCAEPPAQQSIQQAQKELDNGHGADAIRRLERALKNNPGNTDVAEALAFAHLSAGDAAHAGELFNELGLNKDPDEHLYAAQAFKKANQPDRAIEAYRLYLLNEPKQATPWNELGELYISTGNTDEGIAALVKANEIAPTAELSARIAQLYSQNSNAPQTERYLQSALKHAKASRPAGSTPGPIEEEILTQLTQNALEQRKPMEAERHLRQLERDFPENTQLSQLRERLAKVKKSPAEKRADTEKPGTARKPSPSQNVESLPILPASHTPEIKPRSEQLVESLSSDNQNAEQWAALGAAKAKAGEWAWAEASYLEAMRLGPGNGKVIAEYLEVVRKRHSPAEYLDETERQMQKYPEIPELHLIAARGFRDIMQNKRNARAIFSQFLKKFPSHPEAAKVKAELEAMK